MFTSVHNYNVVRQPKLKTMHSQPAHQRKAVKFDMQSFSGLHKCTCFFSSDWVDWNSFEIAVLLKSDFSVVQWWLAKMNSVKRVNKMLKIIFLRYVCACECAVCVWLGQGKN